MYPENRHNGDQQNELVREEQNASVHCVSCDIEILWPPVVVQGKTYCCTGCAAGGPCNCDYSQYRSVTISGVVHYNGLAEPVKEAHEKSSK
jgi:hypothetical protein